MYDWELNNGGSFCAKATGAGVAVACVGVDCFGHVTTVSLFSVSTGTDAACERIGV